MAPASPDRRARSRLFVACCAAVAALWGTPAQAQQAAAQVSAEPAAAESPRFEIKRFEVTGNTLLPQADVDAALAPFVGTGRQFSDVQRALEALEDRYRRAGYGIVQVLVPEQEVTDGVVRFRVIEARLGKVTVEGNKHFDDANVRRSLPALREGATPDSADLAVHLQMAQENPAKQTTVLLRSGAKENEVDATVRVTDERPWKVIGTVDNTGTDATGNYRVGLGFQHANLTNRDDVLNLQAITSPGHSGDVKIFGAGYHLPLYNLKSAIDLVAGYSDVNSGTVQGLFNVAGKGSIYAARWTYYLPKFAEYEHKAWVGYDWRDYQNSVETGGVSLVPDYRIHPVNVTYSGVWRMPRAELGFYATGVRNIPGGADGSQTTFDMVRLGAPDNYKLSRAGFNYVRALPFETQVRLVMSGQYTNDPLLPAEQFGLGGPDSVRGYQLRALTGDRGYNGQAEFYSPDVGRAFGFENVGIRALVFYDWGKVSRLEAQPGELSADRVSSVGGGVRVGMTRTWSLRADYAHVLNPANVGTTDLWRRFNFSFVALF